MESEASLYYSNAVTFVVLSVVEINVMNFDYSSDLKKYLLSILILIHNLVFCSAGIS